MDELIEGIKVFDRYEKKVQRGKGFELAFSPRAFLGGTGAAVGAKILFDRSLDQLEEKGVVKNAEMYSLEAYPPDDMYVPDLLLQDLIGRIESVVNGVKNFAATVYKYTQKAIQIGVGVARTLVSLFNSPSGVELLIDGAAEVEPLTVELRGFTYRPVLGPVQRGLRDPDDVAGPPDEPHNGIGGFFHFMPDDRVLKAPAELTIHYEDHEVVNLNEDTLAIYRWNDADGEWDYVGGAVDTTNNTIKANVTLLGLYTAAPAMPAGKIRWASSSSVHDPVNNARTVTLSSEEISLNAGPLVPDGTVFHALAVAAGEFSGGQGLIVLDQADAPSQAGKIQVSLSVPDVLGAVRVLVYSDLGTASGDEVIGVAQP